MMTQSNYKDSADLAEEQLNSISNSMCFAKWSQVSLHLTNGKTHSCYHPPVHDIDLEEISENPSALHNTKQKKQERQQMLSGERPEGCSYCWKIEDVGGRADRVYRSGEYWAQNSISDIENAGAEGNINPRYVEVNFNQACNFKCSYCGPHLSNTWEKEVKDLGPYKTIDGKHNRLESLVNKGLMPLKVSQEKNPYLKAFWQWWPNLYQSLEVFRMTGGEPLMDSNTFKVLEYVHNNPKKDLELSVTSNMCPPRPELFDKFINSVKRLDDVEHGVEVYVQDPYDGSHWETWQHYVVTEDMKKYHDSDLPSIERDEIVVTFPEEMGPCLESGDNSYNYMYTYRDKAYKNFSLFVSLDSWGKQAEYIRNGMDFDLLWSNTHRFLSETKYTTVSFINTFNILSLPSFKQFLQGVLDLREQYSVQKQIEMGWDKPHERIWFDVPLLRKPQWQCIQMLPPEYGSYIEEAIEFMEANRHETGFKDFEIDKVKRNLEWMREKPEDKFDLDLSRGNFYEFFSQHDKRRGTNFLETFPELQDWWEMCKKHKTIAELKQMQRIRVKELS